MATATLILFLDVVFELIEAGISSYIFFWFSCRQFLFTMSVFREIRRKASIGNDDVMKFMTSQHGNVTYLRYVVLKIVL